MAGLRRAGGCDGGGSAVEAACFSRMIQYSRWHSGVVHLDIWPMHVLNTDEESSVSFYTDLSHTAVAGELESQFESCRCYLWMSHGPTGNLPGERVIETLSELV